jgi:nitrite reductase (NADH) small subunit
MADSLVKIAITSEIAPGQGCVVEVAGRTLALFNVDGRFYAVDNTCPHRGGPLGDGELDGAIVQCPWHGWRWDVTTGANVNNPAVRVACVPVTVRDGAVLVDVGAATV